MNYIDRNKGNDMEIEEILEKIPEMNEYIKNMPPHIKERSLVRVIAPGEIIHQKNYTLDYFAFVCSGEHRVINEFENGNIYMIEKNEPINFIGEVTILADEEKTPVTLEAITECILLQIPRKDFEQWIKEDINLLTLIAKKVAWKLYRSSSKNGSKLFYPPSFILLEYIIQYAENNPSTYTIVIPLTREQLYEELGISIKTINRTIKKLKESNLINIVKGKISISEEQLKLAKRELKVLKN